MKRSILKNIENYYGQDVRYNNGYLIMLDEDDIQLTYDNIDEALLDWVELMEKHLRKRKDCPWTMDDIRFIKDLA